MITKEDLIKYFHKGCKAPNELNIGVEHEKFLFYNKSNKRIDHQTAEQVLNFLEQFGWKPIKEKNKTVALKKKIKALRLSQEIK